MLDTSNIIFTILFIIEMIIKLLGLGLKGYVRDKFNLFDGFIVIVSLIEIIHSYSGLGKATGSRGAIPAFRTFRLLRIFKLARSWTGLRDLLVTIGKTLKDISNFTVLMLLFIFIYSLVGMEFFVYRMIFN